MSKPTPPSKRPWISVLILAAVAAVTIAAAVQMISSDGSKTEKKDPFADPEEIRDAILEARSTIAIFLEQLENPEPGKNYIVKMKANRPNGGVEYHWVQDITFAEGRFSGRLWSKPQNIPGLEPGMPVTCKAGEIADWAILDASGQLAAGGYTQSIKLGGK
jgi:uncharacterized protein YegJ (DUF2314 family)